MTESNYHAVKFIPSEFLDFWIKCHKCNKYFKPDLLKHRGDSMGAIQLNENYFFQRISAYDNCNNCGENCEIKIPSKELKDEIFLYGDEAMRKLPKYGGELFTYSLVGSSEPQREQVSNEIKSLKKSLTPNMNPEEWNIHMKTIWNGEKRTKSEEYSQWNYKTVFDLLDGLGEIIKKYDPYLYKLNIVLAGKTIDHNKNKKFTDYLQHEAYILLVMTAIKTITDLGCKPSIHLDSVKPAKADIVIHEWARDAFSHGSSNLLYALISKGIAVPEPIFVKPASHPFLELADVLSFSVARHHFMKCKKKKPEIDLSCFGRVQYMTMSNNGNRVEVKVSTNGYPWKINYKN